MKRIQSIVRIDASVERLNQLIQMKVKTETVTTDDVRGRGHQEESVDVQDLVKIDEENQDPQEATEIKIEVTEEIETKIEVTVKKLSLTKAIVKTEAILTKAIVKTEAILTRVIVKAEAIVAEVTAKRIEETETGIGSEDTKIEMTTVNLVEMKEMSVVLPEKQVPPQGDVMVKM